MKITINLQNCGITDLCAAHDLVDAANGDRIGGPIPIVHAFLVGLERVILASESLEPEVIDWHRRLLARAVENDWIEQPPPLGALFPATA